VGPVVSFAVRPARCIAAFTLRRANEQVQQLRLQHVARTFKRVPYK